MKAAKARHLSSELRKEELELQVEASLQTLYNEACQVKESMDAYDLPLMDEAFLLLNQALDGGELSWHEYFVEMEIVARRKLEYLKLENRYQKLIAEIYADRL